MINLTLGRDLRGYVSVEVLGRVLNGLLDSGSARTLVNDRGAAALRDVGLNCRRSEFSSVRVANASETHVEGEFTVPFRVWGVIRVVQVLCVPAISTDYF